MKLSGLLEKGKRTPNIQQERQEKGKRTPKRNNERTPNIKLPSPPYGPDWVNYVGGKSFYGTVYWGELGGGGLI